jgi:hypothetical protein
MITKSLLISNNFPQGEEMIKESLLINHHYRDEVIDHIVEKNYKTVIDIGGAMNAWPDIVSQQRHGRNVVTAHMDYNCHYVEGHDTLKFGGNMSNYEAWEPIFNHVCQYEKFEFAICTQTLEDIRDPVNVLTWMPRIAERGYVDVPSKYLELGRGREADSMEPKTDVPEWGIHSPFYGYTGHRWVLNMINEGGVDILYLIPKLAFIEVIEGIEHLGDQLKDGNGFLAFWWEGDIPHKVVGDDFLGPNPPAVFNMYRECLLQGL